VRFKVSSKPHHETTAVSPLESHVIVDDCPHAEVVIQHCAEPETATVEPDTFALRC